MFSVFSNIQKTSDKIRFLQQCAGASFERELIAGPEDEKLWVLKNKDTMNWLNWINNKILFILPTASRSTIDVRIRIATNMLNKLADNGHIPKDICLKYHRRLVSNVNTLMRNIIIEDLPFLP